MKVKHLVYLFFSLVFSFPARSMEIKGTIDLQDDWQPIVYLASLNSPENLFVASPDFIIAETFIQPNGSFLFTISSVPEDARFYRLYMVKGNNSAVEFNPSYHRNFVHLLLDQNSTIEIDAKVQDNTFQVYHIIGSASNSAILEFDRELMERKAQFTADITKTKREYLNKDLEVFIKTFVKKEKNTLVGLYALYHLEDKDTDFLRNSNFYFEFEKRITRQYPGTAYAQAYSELLKELVGFRDMVCEIPGVQPKWKDYLIIAQSLVIFILLVLMIWLFLKRHKTNRQLIVPTNNPQHTYSKLTQKEQEILMFLAAGKANKEIAQELYVELSTVKTHINSIYKQLQLSNRKEAIKFYKQLHLSK